MYQSEWSSKPVLHLFPHWNWLPGQKIDLWCYYNNADEVELFVNGKSQGIRRKKDSHQYHVMWRVTFEPGEVKVIARKNGKDVRSQVIKTAGAPNHIRLSIDYAGQRGDVGAANATMSNQESLTFINAEIVDKDGNLCPWAENQLFFETDNGAIEGVDNGSQFSTERFKDNKRKAFFGKCMVVVKGKGRLTAKAYDLKTAKIDF